MSMIPSRMISQGGTISILMVLSLMAITLYMALAFPYTLFHLKQTETTEVKSVIIVGLNGEESPAPESYFIGEEPPEDLHSLGYGQLTNTGKERMFLLGKFLKLRYYHLLLNGNPRKIFVRSAAVDRCLESAQALLAGLNPPKDHWSWSTTSELNNWQPKAVYSTEASYDDLLSPECNCFKLDQNKAKWKTSTKYQQLINEFRHDLQTLRSNTGLEFEDDLEMLRTIESSLKTRKAFNGEVPAWYTSIFANRLAHIADVTTESRFNSEGAQRLYVGRLLHEITENINTKIRIHQQLLSDSTGNEVEAQQPERIQKLLPAQQPKSKSKSNNLVEPNVFIYMTDKERLSALLSSLQIYSSQPYFGSLLIIELHYDPINQIHFLRLFTISSTLANSFPEPLRVNPIACAESVECAPQQFEQNIRHLMLDKASWQEACLNNVPITTPTPKPLSELVNDDLSNQPLQQATTQMAPTQPPTLTTTLNSSIGVDVDPDKHIDELEENLIVGPTDKMPSSVTPTFDIIPELQTISQDTTKAVDDQTSATQTDHADLGGSEEIGNSILADFHKTIS